MGKQDDFLLLVQLDFFFPSPSFVHWDVAGVTVRSLSRYRISVSDGLDDSPSSLVLVVALRLRLRGSLAMLELNS